MKRKREIYIFEAVIPPINGSLFDSKFDIIMLSPYQAKSRIMAIKMIRSDLLEPYLLMKRVSRGRTTDTRDGKTKDIVASTAGKSTGSWMIYRFRAFKRNRVATPTQSSFHVCWRDGSLLLEMVSKPSKKPNPIFSVTESRKEEGGESSNDELRAEGVQQ